MSNSFSSLREARRKFVLIKGKPQITQISQIAEVKAFRRRDAHKFYHERYACRSSSATGTGADNFLPMTDSSSINQEMNFFG
jgi:hypothetical protein